LAENLRNLVSLQLGRIFDNLTEKETFISAIARTIHTLLEQPENAKLNVLLDASCTTLAIACKYHNFSSNVKTIIIQDLAFFEHLAEPCAKLLALTSTQFEYPQLAEDVYRELGGHNFTAAESNTAKLVSMFLVKHAELAPKDALKYLNLVIGLLDVESTSIRMAIVEVLGRLIGFLQVREDRDEQSLIQCKSLFALLEERLRDVNAFVRCKVLSVLGELCRLHAIPVNRRSAIVQLAINRVKDKSSNVRKRAIQLLSEFIKNHPFGVDGGELDLDFFTSRLTHIEELLNESMNNSAESIDAEKNSQINALLMQKKYYQDASQFVEQINSIVPTLCLLLTSNVKTEVFEVMDFFVDAYLYKIKSSLTGVRSMVSLVWEKDLSTEDGGKRSVKEHLIESYSRIYICKDDRLHFKEQLIETTQSLIR
jgi:condensin complex subunit 1